MKGKKWIYETAKNDGHRISLNGGLVIAMDKKQALNQIKSKLSNNEKLLKVKCIDRSISEYSHI